MDTNTKVLIIDDSAFMRNVLKNILTGAGLSIFFEAENGKEGIEKFEQEKPDLVLLDIIMPEMGGLDVLKEIGSKGNFLVVSAVGQDKVIDEAKVLGAKGYIVKPFDINQVVTEVTKALAK